MWFKLHTNPSVLFESFNALIDFIELSEYKHTKRQGSKVRNEIREAFIKNKYLGAINIYSVDDRSYTVTIVDKKSKNIVDIVEF